MVIFVNTLIYAAYWAVGSIFMMILLVNIIKTRYKTFTNREFVLRFRSGKLKNQGFGGAFFIVPIIDEIIVLSTTVQTQEIQASEVITKENQDVRVEGFVVWRIEDPVKAYQSIEGSQNKGVMVEINKTLTQLVESIIRTTVARLTLDQVLRERSLIIEAILTELQPVVGPLGIVINTAEIRHVDVVDEALFRDLQEKYKQEARLNAQRVNIESTKEIEKTKAFSQQEIRLFQAEQEEIAKVREIERDRKISAEDKELQLAREQKMLAVEEQTKKRETLIAKLSKERLQIEAETKLMETELEAESKKRRHLLEEVQVEAEKIKMMADAEAETITKTANARKQAIMMEAEGEANKLNIIAEAKKNDLIAEAEGKRAILLAEAEGLGEKVKAQGMINEAMLMRELINQLPAIAASIKVGDINWLNMPGSGQNGESPLGIIPKNMVQIMSLAKTFGLDLEGLISTIRGQSPNKSNEVISEAPFTENMVLNPIMDDNQKIIGFDLNNDGEVDYKIPEFVSVIMDDEGKVEGLDLNNDGIVDISVKEILAQA
jgi:regulator of protease activity HflC (stomatin/prohibitin superfamily)